MINVLLDALKLHSDVVQMELLPKRMNSITVKPTVIISNLDAVLMMKLKKSMLMDPIVAVVLLNLDVVLMEKLLNLIILVQTVAAKTVNLDVAQIIKPLPKMLIKNLVAVDLPNLDVVQMVRPKKLICKIPVVQVV